MKISSSMQLTSMISLGASHSAGAASGASAAGGANAASASGGISGLSRGGNLLSSSLSLTLSISSSSSSKTSNNSAEAALAGMLYQMCQYAAEHILTDNPSASNPIGDTASAVNSISSITT